MTDLETELETLIDLHSLKTVMAALANICWEKADHVQTNWQDADLARQWTNAGKSIDKCSAQTAVNSL